MFDNMRRVFQLNPHFDIHTYIHTYMHTDRQTDRQTDIGVCTHVRMHAWTHTCQHANIEVRSKKLEVRSKKWPYQASCISLVGPLVIFNIEVRSKKLEIRNGTTGLSYIRKSKILYYCHVRFEHPKQMTS